MPHTQQDGLVVGKVTDHRFEKAAKAPASDAEVMKVYAETVAEFSDGRGFEAGTVAFARAMLRRHAAPQASEAVRSERLERANKLPEVECPRCELKVISSCGSKGCPTNDGYADLCQPQADKDGGDCAKGAVIDLEAAAKALSECMDYPWAHMPEQGRQQMLEHAQTVINAALSTPSVVKQALTATQTGEKGESDA